MGALRLGPVCLVLAVALGATALQGQDACADGAFVVLVNKNNAVGGLSRSELKRAVTGGIKQWDTGAVIQLGIIPSEAPETEYLAAQLDMSPRELLARIQEQIFKGEMRRPATLRSSADCAAFAASSPGAICVAAAAQPVPGEARAVPIR